METKERILDIYFSSKRTVLPYQTVTLTTKVSDRSNNMMWWKSHPLGESQKYVGILFKKSQAKQQIHVKSRKAETPGLNDYEKIGTMVKVIYSQSQMLFSNMVKKSSGRFRGLGVQRFEILNFVDGGIEEAVVKLRDDLLTEGEEKELIGSGKLEALKSCALQIIQLNSSSEKQTIQDKNLIYEDDDLVRLVYTVAITISLPYQDNIGFLKIDHITQKVDFLIEKMNSSNLDNIGSIEDTDFDLSNPQDLKRVEYLIQNMNAPKMIKNSMQKEINKLKKSRPGMMDHTVSQNYLEVMLTLPWDKSSEDQTDLESALRILDEDHSGLKKVKKRIIEFLAVRALNKQSKGSILCFYGPPGVGKTSLGKSIARALGRKYERISLGGVSDESVLRGHRRTYVGAYPGQIIQALRRAGTDNPVILLDEIDKIGSRSLHGDPSSALLEILDPNQNTKFKDNYLNVPFDLSKIFFIATANSLDTIQAPLRDRMEILSIPGYSLPEKLEIANKYLVKKCQVENGLPEQAIQIQQSSMIKIIKNHTSESGVRELERKISSICRNVAVDYLKFSTQEKNESKKFKTVEITSPKLLKILGPPRYREFNDKYVPQVGTALGLAWTQVGGKVLIIETSYSRGKGEVRITGSLGDVMKESVSTVLSWIKTNVQNLSIRRQQILEDLQITEDPSKPYQNLFDLIDLHIHFPEAAIPKDGPSAGVTICTAFVSLLTGVQIKPKIAMTGEMSLRGQVLPVGGIREKTLAANLANMDLVLLPLENKGDFEEMEDQKNIRIQAKYMDTVWRVLVEALGDGVIAKESKDIYRLNKL